MLIIEKIFKVHTVLEYSKTGISTLTHLFNGRFPDEPELGSCSLDNKGC